MGRASKMDVHFRHIARAVIVTSFAHPRSQEDHLDFHWIDLSTDQIKQHDVLPRMMQEHLVRLVAERDCVWLSTFTPDLSSG